MSDWLYQVSLWMHITVIDVDMFAARVPRCVSTMRYSAAANYNLSVRDRITAGGLT